MAACGALVGSFDMCPRPTSAKTYTSASIPAKLQGDVNSKFILGQRDKPNGIQQSRVSWNLVTNMITTMWYQIQFDGLMV